MSTAVCSIILYTYYVCVEVRRGAFGDRYNKISVRVCTENIITLQRMCACVRVHINIFYNVLYGVIPVYYDITISACENITI